MGLLGARYLVSKAEASVGLGRGGKDPARIEAYCRYVYPHDDLKWAMEAAKTQYSCMTSSMRHLENAGAVGPGFADPYKAHTGMIGPMMVTAGKKWGSYWQCDNAKGLAEYLASADSAQPIFGQLLWIGLNGSDGKVLPEYGGSAHMILACDQRGDAEMKDGTRFDLVETIEGGILDTIGYQIKRRYRRMVVKGPGNAWVYDLKENPDGSFTYLDAGRRLYCVIDPYKGELSRILDAAAAEAGFEGLPRPYQPGRLGGRGHRRPWRGCYPFPHGGALQT